MLGVLFRFVLAPLPQARPGGEPYSYMYTWYLIKLFWHSFIAKVVPLAELWASLLVSRDAVYFK